MKNELNKYLEIKLGVYNKLREKIKTAIADDSLDNKDCIEQIRKILAFLNTCDRED